MESNTNYETLIDQAFTNGLGIPQLPKEVLAYHTKQHKYILPIGTLISYDIFSYNQKFNKTEKVGEKIGVIAGDDRDNSKEDLSDLNYYVVTPENNWCWDEYDMIHFTQVNKIHGSANPIITYAASRNELPGFLIPGEAKF